MTPYDIIDGLDGLVSLPDAVIRANELIDSPNGSAQQIAEVISHDPALSARLLKLVNSAYYSLPSPVDTVTRAITLVGIDELRSLIWASSATQVFAHIATELIDMNQFWHRSVYCGLVAKKLAQLSKDENGEPEFLTGLLHDIGHLALFARLPQQVQSLLIRHREQGLPLYRLEQQTLGFTSADVGSALMESWRLPQKLWQPVRYQQTPEQAGEYQQEARLLHLALKITDCLEPQLKTDKSLDLESLEPTVFDGELLTTEDLGVIAMNANMESFEVLSIINPMAATVY